MPAKRLAPNAAAQSLRYCTNDPRHCRDKFHKSPAKHVGWLSCYSKMATFDTAPDALHIPNSPAFWGQEKYNHRPDTRLTTSAPPLAAQISTQTCPPPSPS